MHSMLLSEVTQSVGNTDVMRHTCTMMVPSVHRIECSTQYATQASFTVLALTLPLYASLDVVILKYLLLFP